MKTPSSNIHSIGPLYADDLHYAPEELEKALEKFVHYYNNERYHESLNNLTPADVYFGRGESMRKKRGALNNVFLIEKK